MDEASLEVLSNAFAPRTDDEGKPLSRIQPYPPMVNPCQICPARCCHTTVKLSLPDALHFCSTLALPFFTSISIVASTENSRSFRLDRDDRFVDPQDGWAGWAELCLRRDQNGACRSLVKIDGYYRCGVYAARPAACRMYPLSYKYEGSVGGPDAIMCPVPYAVTPSQESQLLEVVQSSEKGWGIHEQAVAAWNQEERSERSLESFLKSVLPLVAGLTGHDLSPILTQGTAEQRAYIEMGERRLLPKAQLESIQELAKDSFAGVLADRVEKG